jgi:peptidyl-prolyl cis-trans isomerase B (cyclophilin B)
MRTIARGRLYAPLAVVVVGALAAPGCGGESDEGSSSLPSGCREASEPPPKHLDLKRPRREVQRGVNLKAAVHTSCGTFEIALDARQFPKTVSSFAYLARNGVYDDTTFHRIVPGFVIQGGDPLGTGTGGPGYSIDEKPPANTRYTSGTVAMAKTQVEPPGRSGSQFFVVTAADAGLPPNYAILGKVSSGRDVVKRIERLGDPETGQAGIPPRATVVIRKIRIQERGSG